MAALTPQIMAEGPKAFHWPDGSLTAPQTSAARTLCDHTETTVPCRATQASGMGQEGARAPRISHGSEQVDGPAEPSLNPRPQLRTRSQANGCWSRCISGALAVPHSDQYPAPRTPLISPLHSGRGPPCSSPAPEATRTRSKLSRPDDGTLWSPRSGGRKPETKVLAGLVLSAAVRESVLSSPDFCWETDGPQRPTHEDCSLGAALLRYGTGTVTEGQWGPGRTSPGADLALGAE